MLTAKIRQAKKESKLAARRSRRTAIKKGEAFGAYTLLSLQERARTWASEIMRRRNIQADTKKNMPFADKIRSKFKDGIAYARKALRWRQP